MGAHISKFVRFEDLQSFRSYKFPYKVILAAHKLPYDAIKGKTGVELALNWKLMLKMFICPLTMNI